MEIPESPPPSAVPAAWEVTAVFPPRLRQQRLFPVINLFAARLGREFFRSLPVQPGVYFFHDEDGRLLYIGQSCNLRARIGSYRHVTPERHPRRTHRLVHRIARVEIQLCRTAQEAVETERVLLLEKRPPFNRSGVWIPPPWRVSMQFANGYLQLQLHREPLPSGLCMGPLPSSFRYTLTALTRCLCRWLHPDLPLADFPHRLLHPLPPLAHSLPLPGFPQDPPPVPHDLAGILTGFIHGSSAELMEILTAVIPHPGASAGEAAFWTDQLEAVQKFHTRRKILFVPALEAAAPPRSVGVQPELPGFL